MRWAINFTSYGPVPGGAGIRAFEIAKQLVQRHDVELLVARDTDPGLIVPGARVTRLPVRATAPRRRWLMLRPRVAADVFLTDHYPALADVRTILTLHDRGGPLWRRALIRRHARRAHAVVAVSHTVAQAWALDALVVPNGVAAPTMVRARPRGKHLLVCDPGLPHKDAATARAAACQLGMELREVGRGVRWLPQEQLYAELAQASVVLCPAREEGFGLVGLEALATGAAVVASDIPAHREVLGDAAWFAKPGDVADWKKMIQAARANEPARRANAQHQALKYSWQAAASKLEQNAI